MKRTLKILIPIILIGFLIYYYQGKKISKLNNKIQNTEKNYTKKSKSNSKKSEQTNIEQIDSISNAKSVIVKEPNKNINTDWITYTNSNVGYSIKLPSYWKKIGNEIKAVNLKGKLKTIEVNFKDSVSNSYLLIKYNPNPSGSELYQFKLSQFNLSKDIYEIEKKEIILDGVKSILGSSIRKTDGKGYKLDAPSKVIIIDLLSEKLSGKLEFQFRSNVNNTKAFETFYNTLETFKISINNN